MNELQRLPAYITRIDVSGAVPLPAANAAPETNATKELAAHLKELTAATHQLVGLGKEQLELAKRSEERYQKQHQSQREEFNRWLEDHPHLARRSHAVHDVLRTVLGNAIRDLIDYVDDNQENLLESEFVRTEMIDRFGSVLNHVSSMYSVAKRLSAVAKANTEEASRETASSKQEASG